MENSDFSLETEMYLLDAVQALLALALGIIFVVYGREMRFRSILASVALIVAGVAVKIDGEPTTISEVLVWAGVTVGSLAALASYLRHYAAYHPIH